jgi:hypothetical protein
MAINHNNFGEKKTTDEWIKARANEKKVAHDNERGVRVFFIQYGVLNDFANNFFYQKKTIITRVRLI